MKRTIKQVEFPATAPKLIRVAAYARVSSGKDAMLHSLSAQVSYYSDYIQNHPGWQYCGVYADEAFTGTKDNRENFQRLLSDCRTGKIDMVITKSLSRFSRNTVTLLETIRELKILGINVFFEEQNIYTLSSDGELMMTILASYAQEESRSASENQKWRIRAKFQDGLPWSGKVLGYRIVNGVYEPLEKEAELVQLIFSLYNGGWGTYKIAKYLNKEGYRTRHGNPWAENSIQVLINNYAYTGNLLLQTTFVEDHISKKKCKNQGQLPMYHAEGSHRAIISMQEYQSAQEKRIERASKSNRTSDPKVIYPFHSKLRCSECGKFYRRKTTRTGVTWICRTYNSKGKEFCKTSKAIPEEILKVVTSDVLGLERFDETFFRDQILKIDVGANNELTYVFSDGTTVTRTWKDRSRRDSWTSEMKAAAREAALKQIMPERLPDGRFKKKDCTSQLKSSDILADFTAERSVEE